MVRTIHFSLCEAVYRENHSRISACSFVCSYDFCDQGRTTDEPTQILKRGDKSSPNLTQLPNEATRLRNRQEFQWSQLTELAVTDF